MVDRPLLCEITDSAEHRRGLAGPSHWQNLGCVSCDAEPLDSNEQKTVEFPQVQHTEETVGTAVMMQREVPTILTAQTQRQCW